MKSSPLRVLLAATLLLPNLVFSKDAATIKAPLHGTGLPDATGLAVATLGPKQSELLLQARKLTASHAYEVEIAGIVEASLTTDHHGKASLRFRTPAHGSDQALDFDPRGATLRLLDAGTSVLEGVISGPAEDRGTTVHETAQLEPGDDGPARGHATAQVTVSANGNTTFRVDLTGIDHSPLTVRVNGVEQGEVHHSGKTGRAIFKSNPGASGAQPLDFDPRNSLVDLVDDNNHVVFTGQMQAQVPGVNVASPSVSEVSIPATAAASAGQANARLRIDERARKHFTVEVEGVAVGTYDLLVDGAVVGSISVANTGTETTGEIEFGGADDPMELPLTFDPLGKTLTIQQTGTVFFSGTFNPNVTGTGAPAPEPPSQLQESLTSTGLDADATARARYIVDDQGRAKFTVEVENLPADRYQLTVAGVVRGTLVAKANSAGAVVGEIEFAVRPPRHANREPESGGGESGGGTTTTGGGGDDPAGDDHGNDAIDGTELPLTFDPRGQTIEISSAAGAFFSHLFGSGSAGATGAPSATFDSTVALMSSGTVAGEASARLRQREDGSQRFEVELERAPAGVYDLVIGGAAHGTLTVSAGGEAEVEFESAGGDDAEDAATLNFAVVGQEIDIEQSGVVLFSRVFPVQ